jgi:hypothetical protein
MNEEQRKIERRVIIATGIILGLGVIVGIGVFSSLLSLIIGDQPARWLCAVGSIYCCSKIQDFTKADLNELNNRED